jgi:hypothetical protein
MTFSSTEFKFDASYYEAILHQHMLTDEELSECLEEIYEKVNYFQEY